MKSKQIQILMVLMGSTAVLIGLCYLAFVPYPQDLGIFQKTYDFTLIVLYLVMALGVFTILLSRCFSLEFADDLQNNIGVDK